jgi:flagellar FliL protein
MLVIVAVALLALALAGGGAWVYVSKQRAAAAEAGDDEPVAKVESHDPPTYLPLDNMVVNLADPGGEKVAQIGITLELTDAHVVEKVKQYLPAIRSSVLQLVSQRTSEELLQREGKVKLAADILQEAARAFGGGDAPSDGEEEHGKTAAPAGKTKAIKKKKAHVEVPVQAVLFSSFIVQ